MLKSLKYLGREKLVLPRIALPAQRRRWTLSDPFLCLSGRKSCPKVSVISLSLSISIMVWISFTSQNSGSQWMWAEHTRMCCPTSCHKKESNRFHAILLLDQSPRSTSSTTDLGLQYSFSSIPFAKVTIKTPSMFYRKETILIPDTIRHKRWSW